MVTFNMRFECYFTASDSHFHRPNNIRTPSRCSSIHFSGMTHILMDYLVLAAQADMGRNYSRYRG